MRLGTRLDARSQVFSGLFISRLRRSMRSLRPLLGMGVREQLKLLQVPSGPYEPLKEHTS